MPQQNGSQSPRSAGGYRPPAESSGGGLHTPPPRQQAGQSRPVRPGSNHYTARTGAAPQSGTQTRRAQPAPGRTAASAAYVANRQKQRRKRARQKKLITFSVLLVSVVAFFLVSMLLSSIHKPVASSSLALPVSTPAVLPASPVPPTPQEVSSVTSYFSGVDPSHTFFEAGQPPLYNKNNPLPENYEQTLELADISGGYKMQKKAAQAFIAMQQAAWEEGISLSPISAYRSHAKQTQNYQASIDRYLAQNYTREQAEYYTQQYYAVPGTSEHEAGLAVDINSLEESFKNTDAFRWLQANCSDYGFILRYDATTEPITGIAYEPWHYRYVGANHAKAIQEQGVTLEEYLGAPAVGAPAKEPV